MQTTGPAHAALRHPQQPMMGNCSQLLQPQRQRVPPHLQSIQHISILFQSHFQIRPVPLPKFQELIAQYGPPRRIYTNNGPPFTSNKFEQFLQYQHINHTMSSPTSPNPMASSSGRSKCSRLPSALAKMPEYPLKISY